MKKIIYVSIVMIFLSFVLVNAYVFYSPTGWTADSGRTMGKGVVRHLEADLNPDGSANRVSVTCEGNEGICWRISGNSLEVDPVVPGARRNSRIHPCKLIRLMEKSI